MIIGFCCKDVIHIKGSDCFNRRLFAVEAVANNNQGELGMGFPYPCKKSFSCVDLAVLLFFPDSILYLFRGTRDVLSHVGIHDGCLDDLVEIPDGAFLRLFV